ncbi:hypothetical protein [[Phormidium] sp. ETS-05]|uniref:hypothetical protein n=1 Tax=[Phormidium] sp. ETS-05 TaxID=222819 RepID=UPI0018EF2784|nr:hypothetical protein [[Phormidium] sp. ETS-05]
MDCIKSAFPLAFRFTRIHWLNHILVGKLDRAWKIGIGSGESLVVGLSEPKGGPCFLLSITKKKPIGNSCLSLLLLPP